MRKEKTGIVIRESDVLQPYRVWYKNRIYFFAKTMEEAESKLREAKRKW